MRLPIFLLLSVLPNLLDARPYTLKAGHASLQVWKLPAQAPFPVDNPTTGAKVKLGKKLFFDTRLSYGHNISCASCHSPLLGWSDGLAFSKGVNGATSKHSSPSIVNTGFNSLQMWDGRYKTLEQQARAVLANKDEMHTQLELLSTSLLQWGYKPFFDKAFPQQPINLDTVAKALASYERSIISRNTPFDKWITGDAHSMSKLQVLGFEVFVDPNKGNCAACHSPPNFTDNGFHNIGTSKPGSDDIGRYAIVPLPIMQSSFKTPALREVEFSSPYFHNGSARSLMAVIKHYIHTPRQQTKLSPSLKAISLSDEEQAALLAFLQSLSSTPTHFQLPILPN